jgi:hypothetical protein
MRCKQKGYFKSEILSVFNFLKQKCFMIKMLKLMLVTILAFITTSSFASPPSEKEYATQDEPRITAGATLPIVVLPPDCQEANITATLNVCTQKQFLKDATNTACNEIVTKSAATNADESPDIGDILKANQATDANQSMVITDASRTTAVVQRE